MRVLVVGSGGREHALVWKIAQSPAVDALLAVPGSDAISALARCVPDVAASDVDGITALAQAEAIDLVVVGPEDPLALGLSDRLREVGIGTFGPSAAASRLEASKTFAKEFMQRHGIPTAGYKSCESLEEACAHVREHPGPCVVKADGLALGKGVLICETVEEAEAAIDSVMVDQQFGEAGNQVVIQEFLEGTEISLHVMCDGRTTILFPTSQDHKRALDGDRGLNTGGMGTFSPAPFLSDEDLAQAAKAIIDPWLLGCQVEGIDFRGMLYPGLMLTADGPKVLEFNARWGDPETQVYLMRLETDLVDLFEASIDRRLAEMDVHWSDQAAVCVVMASGGYPESYAKGKPITGIADADAMDGVKVFHAGTKKSGEDLVTSGGRVLGVTALGDTLAAARDLAYAAVGKIKFEGAHVRGDIAAKALPD